MILVFGTVCIDRIRRVPFLPDAGGYVEITEEMDLLGGEAANTAFALKTWGAEFNLVPNALGSGPDGIVLRDLVAEKGLHVTPPGPHTPNASPPTPVCDIYVTPDGERTMFGKNFSIMDTEGLDAVLLSRADWFTAEPNMPTLSREAVQMAHKAGMNLYLMDFVGEDEPIFPGSFWQCGTDWAGTRGNTQKNVVWVQEMVDRTGCFAILSDGPNGFVAGSPDHPVRAYPPYPAPQVVDTTGAGDLFRAGMLFGLDQNWPIPDCLRFASAAGCLKCRSLGATTDVPTVDEIRRHIQEHPSISERYQ